MVGRITGVLLAGLLGLSVLTACGSDDEGSSKPSATSASPSATVPPQPQGPYEFTAKITNWEEYFDDPAVLAAKEFSEAHGGSFNSGEVKPELKNTTTKKVLRKLKTVLREAWDADRHLPDVAELRVDSVDADGDEATVTFCLHYVTFLQRESNGDLMDEDKGVDKNEWRVMPVKLKPKDEHWRASSLPLIKSKTCKGKSGDGK